MGASNSTAEEASDELTGQFDPQEIQALRKAYARLANPSTGTVDSLANLPVGIPWTELWQAMRASHGEPVRWRGFLEAIANVCKGRKSERVAAIAALYTDSRTNLLSTASLQRLLRDAAIAARAGDKDAPLSDSALAAVAADAALGAKWGAGGIDAGHWASWVSAQLPSLSVAHETFLLQYLCALGRAATPGSATRGPNAEPGQPLPDMARGGFDAVQEPLLVPAEGQDEGTELLEPTAAWLLSLGLGHGVAGEVPSWRCLYSSRTMGLSLNRFQHHASGYAGPSLLVVLAEGGELFGAYIDTPLKESDKYWGGTNCCLFTLAPHFHLFRPVGISKNFALFHPPQTGVLATEAYLSRSGAGGSVPEVLGFGGQTARFRLSLEDDMNILRWHRSCTTYAAHPHAEESVTEGPRKVHAIELWGCGGADADAVQRALRERRMRDGARAGKVDRAAMFGLGGGNDWRSEDNVDRMILETAGAHTFYSAQLEKLPEEHGKQ
jgi:hypothetical protein